MAKVFDTWSSRIANFLQLIGFNYKSDPVIGAVVGVVLAAARGMETSSATQVISTFLVASAAVMVLLASWRVFRRHGASARIPALPTPASGASPEVTAREGSEPSALPIKQEFTPLADAARKLYEIARKEGALLATAAERMSGSKNGRITVGSPNDILDFIANHISGHVPIYGKKVPSTLFESIGAADVRRSRFTDGATVLRDTMYDQSIYWIDLAVRTTDFDSHFDDMKALATPRQHAADDDFARGFNRATFKRNPNLKAATLRLTQLRGEGVVIRNDGAQLMFTSHLDAWAKRILDWMKETIETIKVIDEADSEWFTILGEVPAARVPIPNVQLGGYTDREMFVKLFREHDFRLARLDQLLKKYGVGG